jgi:hypothetical protein
MVPPAHAGRNRRIESSWQAAVLGNDRFSLRASSSAGIQILAVQLNAKTSLEVPLDHPLAVYLQPSPLRAHLPAAS